jgi:hypothetical protein
MSRNVTERLSCVVFTFRLTGAGDFAFRSGATKSLRFRVVFGLDWPALTGFFSPFGSSAKSEPLLCGWCHECWVWAYHERRCSGRKMASPGLVVRGSVRLPAAVATRLRGEVKGEDLAPSDPAAWRKLRAVRRCGRRAGDSAATRPRISKNLKML